MKKSIYVLLFVLLFLSGCDATAKNEKGYNKLKELESSYTLSFTSSSYLPSNMECSVEDDQMTCNQELDGIQNLDLASVISYVGDGTGVGNFEEAIAAMVPYLKIDFENLVMIEENIYELNGQSFLDFFASLGVNDLTASEVEERGIYYRFIFDDGELVEFQMHADGEFYFRATFTYE